MQVKNKPRDGGWNMRLFLAHWSVQLRTVVNVE
jgi:hypothetical protein